MKSIIKGTSEIMKKSKYKFLIIFFTNILLFLSIFFIGDFFFFKSEALNYIPDKSYIFTYYKEFLFRDISQKQTEKMLMSELDYHPVKNANSEKNPIVLFGCSFTYGHKIPINSTFHEVLSQYTNRPIYDRSYHGFGVNQMLYQLKNEKLYQIINKKPDYIIYTYIPDHIRRLYMPCLYTIYQYRGAFYKLNKNKKELSLRKNSMLYDRFSIVTFLYTKLFENQYKKDADSLLLTHFWEAKKEVNIHWGEDTKFIILKYFEDSVFNAIQPELEKAGYIIIDRNDLVPFKEFDKNYCLSEIDSHPNAIVWNEITKKLQRVINL